jgi:hypothetical protein
VQGQAHIKTDTAIPIRIDGHETALNSYQYQFTTGKSLKILKPTLNHYGNGSMHIKPLQACKAMKPL